MLSQDVWKDSWGNGRVGLFDLSEFDAGVGLMLEEDECGFGHVWGNGSAQNKGGEIMISCV